LAGTGPVAEGDRRSPRAPVPRDDPYLRQGRSGRVAHRGGLRPGGPPMNLHELVTQYVAFRQTLGERCLTNERLLRSFCRAVGPQTCVTRIQADAVTAFLDGTGPVTSAWHSKYHALKGFFRFAVSRGYLAEAPLPKVLPKRAPGFLPYIYSRDDLRRLLDAIPSYRRYRTRIEPPTLRALLLLLYGAG